MAVAVGCSPAAPETGPPEGWEASGARWWLAGSDTTQVFRDLSTLDAMGVTRQGTPFVMWAQEAFTDLYRSNPEVVDSLFAAVVIPALQGNEPADAVYDRSAAALINEVKLDVFARYRNAAKKAGAEGLKVPADLQNVRGVVELQILVDASGQPVSIELLQSTGTALDDLVMRNAVEATYTDAWVVPGPGKGGVKIPTWVRVSQPFGGA